MRDTPSSKDAISSATRALTGQIAIHGPSLAARAAALIAVSALVTGCTVDERALEPIPPIYSDAGVGATPGTGGSDGGGESGAGGTPGNEAGTTASGTDGGGPSGSGGSSGTGGNLATGGSSGSSMAGSGGVDCGCGPFRCPDLDKNNVPDCDESIALNPSFDSNARGWAIDTGANVSWVKDDAHGNVASGALGLLNAAELDRDGGSLLGARQCLAVEGGRAYHFALQVAVPAEAEATYGGFELFVYDGPACSGSELDDQRSIMLEETAWTMTELTYFTPSAARSVSMRLIALKPFRAPPAEVRFDNVLVRADD